uniref:Fucolectin tachylectin-4 pentraxin-1 domain-containing protein n=1 Tax=Eptatretus burgeri TaxID=7764 RepID=A0A8C4N240_EPTBU
MVSSKTSTGENEAGNGVATESTNVQDANNAVDGNEMTSSETNYETSPWWKLDLKKEYPIYAITVTGPKHEYTKISLKNEVNNTMEVSISLPCLSAIESGRSPNLIVRYLRHKLHFTRQGNNELSFFFGTDLLLYVNASQSSTFDALRDATQALSAVQGASAGSEFCLNACSFTSFQWEPWWRLDLYLEYTIISVNLTARNDQHALRLFGAEEGLCTMEDSQSATGKVMADSETQKLERKDLLQRIVEKVDGGVSKRSFWKDILRE